MGGGRSPDRGSSSGSVTERTDRLTAAYAWQEPQVVEEPDFDPSIDAPFLEGFSPLLFLTCVPCVLCSVSCVGRVLLGALRVADSFRRVGCGVQMCHTRPR